MKLLRELLTLDLLDELDALLEALDPVERRARNRSAKKWRELKGHSPSSAHHSVRVAKLARDFARHLGISVDPEATMLHDIGKKGTPKKILHKPGILSPDEIQVMRRHAPEGSDRLEDIPGERGKIARLLAARHHVPYHRIDALVASGEMDRSQADAVKIVTISDIFDSLTATDREYKMPNAKVDALEIMRKDPAIDPELFDKFETWQKKHFTNEYRLSSATRQRADIEKRYGYRRSSVLRQN